jgi:hypothetical protein
MDEAIVEFIPFKHWSDQHWEMFKQIIFGRYRYLRGWHIKLRADRSGWDFSIGLPVVLPIRGI